MSQALVVESSDGTSPAVLTLVGELDAETAGRLQSHLEAVDPAERLVVDLSGLGFVDSSGLRVIISAHQRHETAGGRLLVRAPSQRVARILQVTGLDGVLHIA